MYENVKGQIRSLAVIIFLAASVGCATQGLRQESTRGQGAGPVVATVNGYAITAQLLELEIQMLPPDLKPLTQTEEGRELLLDSLIVRELILQDAARDRELPSQALWEKQGEPYRRTVVAAYLKKHLSEGVVLRNLRERLAENARIVVPEKDGVDADDEGRLGPQKAEFLRKKLQLFHFGI